MLPKSQQMTKILLRVHKASSKISVKMTEGVQILEAEHNNDQKWEVVLRLHPILVAGLTGQRVLEAETLADNVLVGLVLQML